MLPLFLLIIAASAGVGAIAAAFSDSGEPTFKVSAKSDCSNEFIAFTNTLALNETKKRQLSDARRALQRKIKKYFAEKTNTTTPLFYIQGSVKHGTVIRKQDDTCDIDVGVYFKGKPSITPASIQSNIVKAIGDHTNEAASKRQKCVRIYYANRFHIDLPIYYMNAQTNTFYLGVGKDWHASDPKQFTAWVKSEITGTQKHRLVMYFKAWADTTRQKKQKKMPSGLAFTIWVNKYYEEDKRDDLAFIKTAYALLQYLQKTDKNVWECNMPVAPNDSVVAKLNDEQRQNFQTALEELVTSAIKIFESESKEQCIETWSYLLGRWFAI